MREFFREPRPERSQIAAALRFAFATMFFAQVGVALLIGLVVLLSTGSPGTGGTILGPVLAALALAQLVLGSALPDAVARSGSKGGVLSATLLAAVLLATVAWFLVFAVVTGQSGSVVALLAVCFLIAYSLGFVLTGRFAARAAATAIRPPGQPSELSDDDA